MKRYLAVFTGSPDAMNAWMQLPEAERKRRDAEGIAAWHAWGEKHKGALVFDGGPLSRTKRITKDGIADVRNNLAAFSVIEAESQEAAAKLFLDHPHFAIFPGDGVEVMEVLPIPGM